MGFEMSTEGRLAVRIARGAVLTAREDGAVLLTVGPYRVAVGDDGRGGFAVVDYQASPAGEVVRCMGPRAAAREVLARLAERSEGVAALLAA